MKTVSLKLAKQLKEAGYPQVGSNTWLRRWHNQPYILNQGGSFETKDKEAWAISPTADELYDSLPILTTTMKRKTGEYHVSLVVQYGDGGKGHSEQSENLADALAKMMLWLLENKPSGLIFR